MWERYYNPFRLDFLHAPPEVSSKISFLPFRILIPALNLDLPVVPVQLQDGHWPTTPYGIAYLTTSARPGSRGNSIYYGHNWPRLLGNLGQMKVGQSIQILSSSGPVSEYVVDRIIETSPDDTSVLDGTISKQLTIYTCTGFADTKRLVVIAYLRDAVK